MQGESKQRSPCKLTGSEMNDAQTSMWVNIGRARNIRLRIDGIDSANNVRTVMVARCGHCVRELLKTRSRGSCRGVSCNSPGWVRNTDEHQNGQSYK